MTDKERILAEIKTLQLSTMDEHMSFYSQEAQGEYNALTKLEAFINSMKEEPVSGGLEEATNNYCVNARKGYPRVMDATDRYICNAFKAGAQWKEKNILKPADGDDLPEIDRGVIVLTQPYPLEGSEFAVSFAHRPDPKGWDGKSLISGKIEHYTPKTYDKGQWNIPNVKWWLDIDFSKSMQNKK